MRKNFVDVLLSVNISLEKEYEMLHKIIYCGVGEFESIRDNFYQIVKSNFLCVPFRGTAISLEAFDEIHQYYFIKNPKDFNIDYLLNFCEYWYNFAMVIIGKKTVDNYRRYSHFIIKHIENVITKIGYKKIQYNNLFIFIEQDKAAIEVSGILETNSYDVLYYNHHSLKRNIIAKKELLTKFANILEAKRTKLKQINSKLETQIFQLFNSMNIRHNNIDVNSKNYIPYLSEISEEELEYWYDEVYQMFLLAMLELEQLNRKPKLEKLLENLSK